MSLHIDVDDVTAVLLDDGWHEVLEQSFELDAYECFFEDQRVLGGGTDGISATGFAFTADDGVICGPANAIRALRLRTSSN